MPMLQVFDCPDALSGLAERSATTIAPQALLLLNNELVRAAADGLASGRRGATPEARIRKACELALDACRTAPRPTRGWRSSIRRGGDATAWRDYCQVLLCLNEFVFVE